MVDRLLSVEQLGRLRSMFKEYSMGSHYRQNALLMRTHVHAFICALTVTDKLAQLSLDDFDRHIWQLGSVQARGKSFDWHHADRFLAKTDPDQMRSMIDVGEIRFSGNVTWGSAVGTLRAYAHGRSNVQMQANMRRALMTLLHHPDPIERRLHQVKDMRIGFGRNVCSGLLMVWHPEEYILYNAVSEQFWDEFELDFAAGSNWVRSYLRYKAFCRDLLGDSQLGLQNLIELDVFLYWHTSVKSAPASKKVTKTSQKRKPKPVAGRIGITLAQLEVTRREMSPERFRAVWGELYDRLLAEERDKTITEVTQADLGERARRKVDQVHKFLCGQSSSRPKSEVICRWIDFCYELELHRETALLLQYVLEDEADPAFYRCAKRLADASKVKLGW